MQVADDIRDVTDAVRQLIAERAGAVDDELRRLASAPWACPAAKSLARLSAALVGRGRGLGQHPCRSVKDGKTCAVCATPCSWNRDRCGTCESHRHHDGLVDAFRPS